MELDIVNGSLCNLFALAFMLASFRFAIPCYTVLMSPNKDEIAMATVATLLYRSLPCWCLAKPTF